MSVLREKFSSQGIEYGSCYTARPGGATSWENVVISCIRCNSKKSNRLPKEAGMRLLKEPKRPPRRPFMTSLYGKPMVDTWSHFVQGK